MVSKFKILHCDNSTAYIETFKRFIIEDMPVDYEYAYDAKSAETKLKNTSPDLLIVDLMLENEFDPSSGIQFIKTIHFKYPRLNKGNGVKP